MPAMRQHPSLVPMRKFPAPPTLSPMHPFHLLRRSGAFHLAFFQTVLALLLGMGSAPAHAAQPQGYSKDGVSFEHPVGWKVTEDVVAQDDTRMRSIDLEGPNEAVVTLMFSPFFRAKTLKSLLLLLRATARTPPAPTPRSRPEWAR
jgi:hypothetical protein